MKPENYIEQLKEKGYAVVTLGHYRVVLGWFEGKGFNQESITRYQQVIQELSMNTRNRYLNCLKKYLKQAKPKMVKYVVIPKMPKGLPRDIPDQDEVQETLQKPNVMRFMGIRDKVILEVLYSCGVRRSEAANLKLEDIDLKQQVIRVIQGKNQKDRLVPIAKQSMRWLEKYLNRVRPALKPRDNFLFLTAKGKQISNGVIYKTVKRYGTSSPHKYRHACATHLAQNGMRETSIQRILGHARVDTTGMYMKLTIQELKASYRKHHPRDAWQTVR